MILDKLIEFFMQFPGVGPRQAKRFAYFLADEDESFIKNFTEAILKIKKNIKQCPSCFRFFEPHLDTKCPSCSICSGLNRKASLLMIVEKDVDLDNIEKSGIYNGKYFVLGGVIALTNRKIPPAGGLRFKELFEKVKKEKQLEIILALNATVEGENTSRYIEKILEPLKVKISKLGRGLSTGTELEYSDSETIKNALESRK